jgi:DNA polymerase III subunit delta
MHVNEVMAKTGREDLPPVLLFGPGKAPFGKEPFEPVLADRAADTIVKAYVDPSMADLAFSVYYADETPAGAIVQEARTMPFLVERRVILVRNGDHYNRMSGEKGSALAPLIEYISHPSESALLLIISGSIDKRKKFYKAANAAGGFVECPQLSDAELRKWITAEVAAREKNIASAAADALIMRSGSRLSDISNALSLVLNYAGDAALVTVEDVTAACTDVAEESVFTMTDAIAASQPDKALAALYDLCDLGKSPDELLAIVNWLLESAYSAAPETGAKIKSNFVAKKVMPLVEKFGVQKLKAALALCTETHFMIRSTGADRMLALELLVIKLSAPRSRRRRR